MTLFREEIKGSGKACLCFRQSELPHLLGGSPGNPALSCHRAWGSFPEVRLGPALDVTVELSARSDPEAWRQQLPARPPCALCTGPAAARYLELTVVTEGGRARTAPRACWGCRQLSKEPCRLPILCPPTCPLEPHALGSPPQSLLNASDTPAFVSLDVQRNIVPTATVQESQRLIMPHWNGAL